MYKIWQIQVLEILKKEDFREPRRFTYRIYGVKSISSLENLENLNRLEFKDFREPIVNRDPENLLNPLGLDSRNLRRNGEFRELRSSE